MKTAMQRKQDERGRKRASGLVLKQVWVPPKAWPAIRDLATGEAEAFVFAGAYSTNTPAEHATAFAYGLASEMWQEIRLQAAATQQPSPYDFCLQVLRAMIKTAPEPFTVTPEDAIKARKIVFEEDADNEN